METFLRAAMRSRLKSGPATQPAQGHITPRNPLVPRISFAEESTTLVMSALLKVSAVGEKLRLSSRLGVGMFPSRLRCAQSGYISNNILAQWTNGGEWGKMGEGKWDVIGRMGRIGGKCGRQQRD